MYSKTVPPLAAGRKRQSTARRYLRQVKRRLICPYRQKKAFLSQLEDELFLFGEDSEDAGWDALVAQFGTPENMADEFMAELEPGALWKYQRRKINLMFAVVCVTAALILAMQAHTYVVQMSNLNGYVIETITIGPEVPTDPDDPALWSETLPMKKP